MTIQCNVTGSERKRLAHTLGVITLCEPVYCYAPTFAYTVGEYTVDKDGTISCPDSAAREIVEQIVSRLAAEGFSPAVDEIIADDSNGDSDGESEPDEVGIPAEEASGEMPAETPNVAPEPEAEAIPEAEDTEADVGAEALDTAEDSEAEAAPEVEEMETAVGAEAPGTAEDSPEDNPIEEESIPGEDPSVGKSSTEDETKLTISIPRSKLRDDALARLRTVISNKEVLFQRALLTDSLPVEVTENEVSFPWFTLAGIDGEAMAYAQFITALCNMVAGQTRVLDKPYDGDNDRFAMRIFMVRLGMKGPQYALARKLMINHLSGNSGWRYGSPSKKREAAVTAITEEDIHMETVTTAKQPKDDDLDKKKPHMAISSEEEANSKEK